MVLWPYVNGKALVNKLSLMEMEASDMLDVIHYFFDDDLRYATPESIQMHDAVRTSVFETLYQVKYPYSITKSAKKTSTNEDDPFGEDFAVKPFVPSTEFSGDDALPFGDILDGPLR